MRIGNVDLNPLNWFKKGKTTSATDNKVALVGKKALSSAPTVVASAKPISKRPAEYNTLLNMIQSVDHTNDEPYVKLVTLELCRREVVKFFKSNESNREFAIDLQDRIYRKMEQLLPADYTDRITWQASAERLVTMEQKRFKDLVLANWEGSCPTDLTVSRLDDPELQQGVKALLDGLLHTLPADDRELLLKYPIITTIYKHMLKFELSGFLYVKIVGNTSGRGAPIYGCNDSGIRGRLAQDFILKLFMENKMPAGYALYCSTQEPLQFRLAPNNWRGAGDNNFRIVEDMEDPAINAFYDNPR